MAYKYYISAHGWLTLCLHICAAAVIISTYNHIMRCVAFTNICVLKKKYITKPFRSVILSVNLLWTLAYHMPIQCRPRLTTDPTILSCHGRESLVKMCGLTETQHFGIRTSLVTVVTSCETVRGIY